MSRRIHLLGLLAVGAACLGAGRASHAQAGKAPAPEAKVEGGRLRGFTAEGVTRFEGVPYARPPVGALRWRPPEPVGAWSGVRPADRFGALCMQKISKDNGVGPGPASEDCLTLNVFAPAGRHGRLPVMVWVHGGGLVNGSGTADLYDGSALARQGVVVVTLNYRLGRFGFFALPALTAEAGGGPTANYGLMDQVAALQWVRRNISAFGGDPDAVTLFGESAGGTSVNRLMTAPQARGLFARAIVESGLGDERGRSLAQSEADGVAFAAKAGVQGGDLRALRALPAQAIVDAGDISMNRGEAPIVDGRMVTAERPIDAFRAGQAMRIPYLVGSNSQEIPAVRAEGVIAQLGFSPAQAAALQQAYGSPEAYHAHAATDGVFAAPARALARAQAATGAPTYLYRFSVASPVELQAYGGAIHASERQYVFQTLRASAWPTTANDAAQARTMSAYWVAFARTGDPNGGARPAWPAYGPSDRLLDFTNTGPVARTVPDAAVLDQVQAALDAPAR